MQISTEKVTPRTAEQWLNANPCNRSLREGVVEKYAADMRAGKWTKCIDPIAFYEDGELADGQHRLYAIIESSTPQEFIIVRGLDRASGLNIDVGLPRTLVDNARISKLDDSLSNELLSVARAVEMGQRAKDSMSSSQRLEIVDKHREAVTWALKHGVRGRGLRNAMLLAAVARAWYHEPDKDRLARFGAVASTGMSESPDETAAVAIRNFFISQGSAASASPQVWRDNFLKAQNAIWYFMRSRKLTVIKGTKDEQYPLKKARK